MITIVTSKKTAVEQTVDPKIQEAPGSSSVAPARPEQPKERPEGEAVTLEVINLTGDTNDQEAFRAKDTHSENNGAGSDENAISKEWARAVLAFPYELISEYTRKPYWRLTKAELDLMDEPAARIFSKLFTRYADSNPDGYMLAGALVLATSARYGKMKSEQTKEQQANTAGENGERLVMVYD